VEEPLWCNHLEVTLLQELQLRPRLVATVTPLGFVIALVLVLVSPVLIRVLVKAVQTLVLQTLVLQTAETV
jgi:hypothetical protein